MKQIAPLLTVLFFVTSCGESTRVVIPANAKLDAITWSDYHKWCGPNNLKRGENFKKIKGKTVTWVGKVYDVLKDPGMEDTRSFDEHIVRLQLPESGSLLSDVTIRVPKGQKAHKKYKRGDYVAFRGKIAYLGSKLNDHIIEVTKYKKVTPKKKF